jgi:hypothetical protein
VPLISKGRSPVQAPDLVVESITATSSGVEVTIMNRGALPVVDAFWVDVYLDPVRPPAQVNETWDDLASMGLVWGVNRAALPLEPGQTLTLVVGDDYYSGSLSYVVWPLPVGMVVYAQVDSVGSSEYGAVREAHEISGGFYNNVGGPVTVVAGSGQPPLSTDADLPNLEGLPPR